MIIYSRNNVYMYFDEKNNFPQDLEEKNCMEGPKESQREFLQQYV